MRPGTTSAVVWRASLLSALFVAGLPRDVRADDVSDELTAGILRSTTQRTSSPYLSNRLGGSIDASDKLSLSLDARVTRYFKTSRQPGENIYEIVAAGDYAPNDHWSFGLD